MFGKSNLHLVVDYCFIISEVHSVSCAAGAQNEYCFLVISRKNVMTNVARSKCLKFPS